MSVTSISRDTNNNVSIARMTSNDTIATITGADYIAKQQNTINGINMGPWQWFVTDFIACRASDGNVILTFTDATFATVQQYGGGGGAFLPLAGGTMSGIIDMGTHKITNVVDPTGAQEAATKHYVDAAVSSGVTPLEVQESAFNTGIDIGILNAYQVVLSPGLGALVDGQKITLLNVQTGNSGASTLDANGTAIPIHLTDGSLLTGGELLVGHNYNFSYSLGAGAFILEDSSAIVVPFDIQILKYNFANDSGITDAYIGAYNPPITAIHGPTSVWLLITAGNNTGAATLDVGTGQLPIVYNDGLEVTNILPNTLVNNGFYEFELTYTNVLAWVVLNPSVLPGGSTVTPVNIQDQAFTYAPDTGVSGTYVLTPSPAITSYVDGQKFGFTANSNSVNGNNFANVSGLGNQLILDPDTAFGIKNGSIVDSFYYEIVYTVALGGFVLVNPPRVSPPNVQQQYWTAASDTGSANALTIPSPGVYWSVDSYGRFSKFSAKAANNNTGATTFQVDVLAVSNVTDLQGNTLVGGEILAGRLYDFEYQENTTTFAITNPSQFPSGMIKGVATNSNAAAGFIGEFVESVIVQGSAVALTSTVATSVTSISLTAGDWDVFGSVVLIPANGTIVSEFYVGIDTTATIPATQDRSGAFLNAASTFTGDGSAVPSLIAPYRRFSLATTTTIYLGVLSTFTVSTNAAFGNIRARRAR